ncbi:hypothetical protein UFOVP833_14 [uncultured Caudovirales phage]|uniref:Uncharacterized protein n=1 Tax=uncultured Caudovirales phage TaxID=2100421 RepID=A0A6J5PBM6_9CAUD|nr:hypothetical protein UFOVP833_14 [uncultured Caudovirales phage]CAB4218101.1 hypothetical protein UFOVP1603_11 [uncultured Caudovirales phage]
MSKPKMEPMQCVSEPDGTCRHIVCPRHHRLRNPLAYCPWERANGHARTIPGAEATAENLEGQA